MRRLATLVALCLVATGVVRADDQPVVQQTEAGKKSIDKIKQLGGLVMELAQNDSHLEVSYLQTDGKFSDEYLAPLKDLKGVIHLNLRGQPVTDAQLAYLKDLTTLTELHLEKTKVTDKGLEQLKGLVNLEYLNLYGTEVTDAGLANLEGMKNLKHLYLWQTKVTAAGTDKLKKAVPGVDANLGLDTVEKPKEEKKPEEKKALPALGASTVGLLGSPHGQAPLLTALTFFPGRTEKKPDEKKDEKKPDEKKPDDKKPDDKKPEPKKEGDKKQ